VIRQLLGLSPGDAIDAESVFQGRERLVRSGFFHDVSLSTRPGARRGLVILVLNVRERHQPYLDTGFGFRDPEGWYLTLLGLRSENPFGYGGRATAGIRFGFRTVGLEGELRMPLRADRRLSLRVRLRGYEEQALWYETEPGWQGLYDEHRLKLERSVAQLALSWRPHDLVRLELGLGHLEASPADEARNRDQDETVPLADLPPEIREEVEPLRLPSVQASLRLGGGGMDGRPGHSLHLDGRWVAGGLGADRDYLRLSATLRSTLSLAAGQSLALGFRAGVVGDQAPWYERFRLGGSYSLRGFRDHSLSPSGGHRGYWTAAAEYRFPMIRKRGSGDARLSGLVFLDGGRGWLGEDPATSEIDYEALQIGGGYGVRLHLPWLGVVGFDVGLPITEGVTGETVWYYLTVGHSF